MFIESPRRKATSVRPDSQAKSTASEDGADTAASTGTPAITAFWVNSNDARPLTRRQHRRAQRDPIIFERPANHLIDGVMSPDIFRGPPSIVPSTSNSPAACRPPVLAKTFWAERSRSGIAVSVCAATPAGWSPGQ